MQYSTLFLTENRCYKSGRTITARGVVVHSTGANNPNLKRYVGPDDGVLGENRYDNHWNRSNIGKCVHAFIGYDKNNVVRCYQTLPWDCRPWGCGGGSKGSYNNSHIQFEICEDDMGNQSYFEEAFGMAVDLCAYLCRQYDIPVDNIVSHKEAGRLGYASNHGDPEHWMSNHGWTMNVFRQNVSQKMGETDGGSSHRVLVVTYSGSDGLNIRSAPRQGDNIVRVVFEGDELTVIEKIGRWFKLEDGNYVTASSRYVSFR